MNKIFLINNLITNEKYFIHAKGMLIYHLMGMGKTILAISCIVNLWNDKKIIILAPKSLHQNFKDSIIKFAKLMFKNDIVNQNNIINKASISIIYLSLDWMLFVVLIM